MSDCELWLPPAFDTITVDNGETGKFRSTEITVPTEASYTSQLSAIRLFTMDAQLPFPRSEGNYLRCRLSSKFYAAPSDIPSLFCFASRVILSREFVGPRSEYRELGEYDGFSRESGIMEHFVRSRDSPCLAASRPLEYFAGY